MTKRVLFVCLGNICRSPTAEGVFRAMLSREDDIETDSAGTGGYHIGSPPDPRAVQEAKRRGIDITDLRTRQVEAADFNRFDIIIAMDRSNLTALHRIAPSGHTAQVQMMLKDSDVPDPYYDDGFERVFDMLEAASRDLLTQMQG